MSCEKGVPSSLLDKKQTISSWKRHMLCDSVLTYGRNRWEFEHVIRNSMGNEIWSIYNDKYFEIWTFYTLCPLWFPAFSAVLRLLCRLCYSGYTSVKIEVRSIDFVL